jgi:hypothetical protein
MSNRAAIVLAAAVAAGVPIAAAGQGKGLPTYEPQLRLRTALDTCGKSEVMRDAYCVKKCASGFRMELSGKKPMCIGLKADATYTPPKPAYQQPKPNPSRQPPPGA